MTIPRDRSFGEIRFQFCANAIPRRSRRPPAAPLPDDAADVALAEMERWPGYAPTPLVDLPGWAGHAAVDRVWYKHEGPRFGVGSFKPLGGGYAVARLATQEVARRTGASATIADVLAGRHREVTETMTVTCATDGNHGRAVAWAARLFGCRSVVYLASHVSEGRARAIAGYGAEVVRTEGNHDDAVRLAAQHANTHGWFVISETGSASSPDIATDVVIGYSALLAETAAQLDAPPTHLFVPAGVGGLGAGLGWDASRRWPGERPLVVSVEADTADCVFRSIQQGRPVRIGGAMHTVMGGLAAGEVSEYGWPLLQYACDACLSIPDEAAIATLRRLATGPDCPHIAAGESGVAGLAGAMLAMADPTARRALGIDRTSRILAIGTEGATDETVFEELVGVSPAAVIQG